jgi:hypothetical protein
MPFELHVLVRLSRFTQQSGGRGLSELGFEMGNVRPLILDEVSVTLDGTDEFVAEPQNLLPPDVTVRGSLSESFETVQVKQDPLHRKSLEP